MTTRVRRVAIAVAEIGVRERTVGDSSGGFAVMPSQAAMKPEIKPWVIPAAQREKIERLNATSAWLRKPPDPELLKPYRGQWVAARDCRIIAAADTLDELYRLLECEPSGSYMIACFRGGRIRCEPR